MSVDLSVNGYSYTGWQQVSVTRSMERLAADFSLQIAAPDIDIKRDDHCLLLLDGLVAIDGYVDEIITDLQVTESTITIKGRSKTAILIDTAAKLGDGFEASDITFTQLARKLAAPYDIKVVSNLEQIPFARHTFGVIPTVAIKPSESVFTLLQRHARELGLFLYGYGDTIYISRNASNYLAATLTLGGNIESIRYHQSNKQVYQVCEVLGQSSASTDTTARATSSATSLPKQLIVVADQATDIAHCTERAAWELGVRAGRALTIETTTSGWTYQGRLWPINRLARVNTQKNSNSHLITQVQFTLDNEQGKRTSITLRDKDAFAPRPQEVA